MVLDKWLALQDSDMPIDGEIRTRLISQLAKLVGQVSDGHLNGARIDIDEDSMTLSLNDDSAIRNEYASPELLRDEMKVPFASAVFSFGVLMDEFRRGATYWREQDLDMTSFEAMVEEKGDDWLPVASDDPLADAIKACVSVNPEERPQTPMTLVELLNTVGIAVNIDQEEMMMTPQAKNASTANKPESGNATADNAEKTRAAFPVGIDLGTSYSTVAYYKDGRLHFLEIRRQLSTPSAIFFEDVNKEIYGEPALRKGIAYPESLFKHFKRNIGTEEKFSFACCNKQREASACTYIFDTNVLIEDPQILVGIDSKHKVIVPKLIYEELNFCKGKEETRHQAETAIEFLEEAEERIAFEDSHTELLPKDFFSYEEHSNNNRNDNRLLSIALFHDDVNTVVVTSDKGIHRKTKWLKDEQEAKFCVMDLKEFQFAKTVKLDDPADIKLSGKEGAVLFLKYLRRELARELSVDISEIKEAVITVPQLFNVFQREETKEAAHAAGFSEVEIQPEPVAAAVAYGLEQESEKNLLVYDFGGGTFDVAIIRREGDNFRVLGTGGDPKLGGEDFTQLLVQEFENRLLDDYDIDMTDEDGSSLSHEEFRKNRENIWSKCEQLKRDLSESEEGEVAVPVYTRRETREHVSFRLNRDEFEDINAELVVKSRKALDNALKDAGLTRDAIDIVILAGGTSSIPCLRTFVERYFGSRTSIMKDRDTATLIAAGAAAFADRKWNENSTIHQKIMVYDRTVDDFGVAYKRDAGDLHYRFASLISAGEELPCKQKKPRDFSLPKDGATELPIMFFKRKAGSTAELTTDEDLSYIGKVLIRDLPPLKQAETIVKVTFELTKEYLLEAEVTIMDKDGKPVTQPVRVKKMGA